MDQTLCLRGANFKVRWTLTEADRPDRATWEGRGPAHSYARTAYALQTERRWHAVRVRERVQGARRFPRRGGQPDADRRRARARGEPLAPAAQSAARKRAGDQVTIAAVRGPQRRFLLCLTALAALCVAAQAITGVSQLALYMTPVFLITALLLSGRYVGEEKIVARWRAAVAAPAGRAGAPPVGARARSALFARSTSKAPSPSAARRPSSRRPPDGRRAAGVDACQPTQRRRIQQCDISVPSRPQSPRRWRYRRPRPPM